MVLGKSMLIATLFGCALTLPALAQSNPTADDIIKSLKPSATMGTGTRGIRPANSAAPAATPPAAPAPSADSGQRPATPPARVAAARPAAPPEAPSANLEVQFASNSAELTPAARATLDQLGKALTSSDLAGYRFRIEGHTDTVGSADQNKSLSAKRADAVVAYLNSVYHVDPTHLQAVGMGETELAVPTGPQVAEPRNRRVRVVNLGA
jgi:outer membrane protein OmpA-like peptidoglycan-associated protein